MSEIQLVFGISGPCKPVTLGGFFHVSSMDEDGFDLSIKQGLA